MIGFDSLLRKNYMEIPLLPTAYTNSFDVVASEKGVQKKVQKFIGLQVEYSHILPPQITRSYDVVYNDSSRIAKDNVGNYVEKKITTEEEVKIFYNDIYNALSKLNKQEVMYFIDALYNGQSDAYISENRKVSAYQVKKVKDSCIIKLAQYFNVGVLCN